MKKVAFVFSIVMLFSFSVYSFPVMGARSLSMGGTGVASVNDASSVYWNPAAMSFLDRGKIVNTKFDLGIDIMQNMSDQISNFKNLDSDYDNFIESIEGSSIWGAQENVSKFKNLYNKYSEKFLKFDDNGVGTNMNLAGGFFFNIKGVPFIDLSMGITAISDIQFYSRTADISVLRTIPLDYLSISNILGTSNYSESEAINTYNNVIIPIIDELDSGDSVFQNDERQYLENYLYTKYVENPFNSYQDPDPDNRVGIEDNNSEVVVDGIILNEFLISFSRAIEMDKIMGFAVGGNLKLIKGYNYSKIFKAEEFKEDESDNEDDNIFDKFNDPFEGNTIGIDIALYMQLMERLKIGLTVRNALVGEIKWDEKDNQITPKSYKPETMARIGFFYDLNKYVNLAADADLTKKEGEFTDIRNISLGSEFNIIKVLNLRVGTVITPGLDNKLSDSTQLLTAGLGLDFKFLTFDLAAALTPDDMKFNFDEENMPQRIGLAASLGVNF